MTVGSASRNWFASGAADSRGLLAAALDISADLIYVVDVATGRFVDDVDVARRARVCVLGHELKQRLFRFRDPIGQYAKVGGTNFRVIGVMEERVIPSGKAITCSTMPIFTLFPSDRQIPYSLNASRQAFNPYIGGSAIVAVLKLLIRIKTKG